MKAILITRFSVWFRQCCRKWACKIVIQKNTPHSVCCLNRGDETCRCSRRQDQVISHSINRMINSVAAAVAAAAMANTGVTARVTFHTPCQTERCGVAVSYVYNSHFVAHSKTWTEEANRGTPPPPPPLHMNAKECANCTNSARSRLHALRWPKNTLPSKRFQMHRTFHQQLGHQTKFAKGLFWTRKTPKSAPRKNTGKGNPERFRLLI